MQLKQEFCFDAWFTMYVKDQDFRQNTDELP